MSTSFGYIPFNRPPCTGNEEYHVLKAMQSGHLSGDGEYSRKCESWFDGNYSTKKAFLTPSCTQALEMAAILIDVKPGDEIIMPSYTFVSTANAFVVRGAKIVFVDIRPDTMNIDEKLIESAITSKTKAIVPVHYAGIACEMDEIMSLATKYNLYVIEDAAQGFKAAYNGKPLGTIGHFGAYSFHETKNISSGGEGGLLLVNRSEFVERAEIIREKGTNRNQFFRGAVAKYSWVDIGSSYLPSELQSAYLWSQLNDAERITDYRKQVCGNYKAKLLGAISLGVIDVGPVQSKCKQNGHMFYLKVKDLAQRTSLLAFLSENGIGAVFHYVPLHTSLAGRKYSVFSGEDVYTTKESERLIRLPVWYGLPEEQQDYICSKVLSFFGLTAAS